MAFIYQIPSRTLFLKDRKPVTVTLSTTPASAKVVFNYRGVEVEGKSIGVMKWSRITYEVSADYHYPASGSALIKAPTVIPVTLVEFPVYTLTVTSNQADATITFSALEGEVLSKGVIKVHSGTTVKYTVSKPGYTYVTGSVEMYEDKTIEVTQNYEWSLYTGDTVTSTYFEL